MDKVVDEEVDEDVDEEVDDVIFKWVTWPDGRRHKRQSQAGQKDCQVKVGAWSAP